MWLPEAGSVAICMVEKCVHNLDNQCHAARISVGYEQGHADCATFKAKQEAA